MTGLGCYGELSIATHRRHSSNGTRCLEAEIGFARIEVRRLRVAQAATLSLPKSPAKVALTSHRTSALGSPATRSVGARVPCSFIRTETPAPRSARPVAHPGRGRSHKACAADRHGPGHAAVLAFMEFDPAGASSTWFQRAVEVIEELLKCAARDVAACPAYRYSERRERSAAAPARADNLKLSTSPTNAAQAVRAH